MTSGARASRPRSNATVSGFAAGLSALERRRDRLADPAPRLAFEHDEPPRRQPAMVGHPRRDGEERLDLRGRRAGLGEKVRRDRAAGLQEGEGFVHVRFMGSEP